LTAVVKFKTRTQLQQYDDMKLCVVPNRLLIGCCRNTRGRKANLVLYTDDDANDLSDLGIGASGKSNINEEFEHAIYQKVS
jgi:hypothetical protein